MAIIPGSQTVLAALCLIVWPVLLGPEPVAAQGLDNLFGYREVAQENMNYLPQWLTVLERHLTEDVPEGDCAEASFNTCHLKNWLRLLESAKGLPRREQLAVVNNYANSKQYVLDISNYGREDYWAIAREFLYHGGDCEDYAITKFFSLRWLGFQAQDIRIVILQDTNLRIPHAVLAVSFGEDILIMDNQSQEVLSQDRIAHYVPLYSVNDLKWWLHLPAS